MTNFPTEGTPPFINRRLSIAEWNQYVASYRFGTLPPSRLVLHHTFRPTQAQWAGLPTMRGIQRFYAGKGWTAGPHIFAAPDGIWLATPMSQVGIHAGLGNGSVAQGWYSIGLEMVGNFNASRPDGAVWRHAVVVMGELSRRLAIPPERLISFHRDYTNTKSCPGWAVSRDWVRASVQAYLSNTTPPTSPPPNPEGITPDDEVLLERLLEESFRQRTGSQGYNHAWAFHEYAVENALGVPMAPSTTITEGGRRYDFQPFARDTLYTEVPNWGDVRLLSQLLGGSIPPSGLGRRLLDATYQTGGSPFRPDWAFHQFALLNRLGPPVGRNATLTVDGRQYAYQVFACDTLYNLVPNWGDVRLLSRLATVSSAPDVRLREALLAATYAATGQTYRPDWAFHQLARSYAIGTPLSGSYQIVVEGRTYALQAYALDTLYNLVPRWSDVRRMTFLAANKGRQILGAASDEGDTAPAVFAAAALATEELAPPVSEEPPQGLEQGVVRYTPQTTAFGERGGKAVEMVILHGVPGPAEATLQQMVAFGSRFATHYFLGLDGVIYQLMDEGRAAWHAGMALAGGPWWNFNRMSIGIALERPEGWPAESPGDTTAQNEVLRGLLRQLDARYKLPPNSVMLWSSLAGSNGEPLEGLDIPFF